MSSILLYDTRQCVTFQVKLIYLLSSILQITPTISTLIEINISFSSNDYIDNHSSKELSYSIIRRIFQIKSLQEFILLHHEEYNSLETKILLKISLEDKSLQEFPLEAKQLQEISLETKPLQKISLEVSHNKNFCISKTST